jgi:hypothetical protein
MYMCRVTVGSNGLHGLPRVYVKPNDLCGSHVQQWDPLQFAMPRLIVGPDVLRGTMSNSRFCDVLPRG